MRNSFLVSWMIDVDDDDVFTPKQAAIRACEIQQDPNSIANYFEVKDSEGKVWGVDLFEDTVSLQPEFPRGIIKGTKTEEERK